MKPSFLLAVVAAVASVSAKWAANLNYKSPWEHHPFMAIAIHKVVRRTNYDTPFNASQLNFTHGVASGDPFPNSVILWTRCSPMYGSDNSNTSVSGLVPLYDRNGTVNSANHVSTAPVCVNYKVALDRNMTQLVTQGQAYTSSDVDYTLKVEATGLQPFAQYYYQFTVCNSSNSSPVGRTKTAPTANQQLISPIRLAVYSCSNYPFGYFNAYGNSARKDSVDYVVHLGDFIYEYADGIYGWGYSIGRASQPNAELRTLYDYRTRHAQYRSDLDAILSFSSFAWIPVWDDHEVGDNTYKDGMADQNNTEASFVQYDVEYGGEYISFDQRKMNAVRAYFEWMPIRQVEMDDNLRIWRNFQMGTLFDLIMLDTRQYDRSITDLYWNTDYIHQISNDAGRSLMGSRQENWFYNTLSQSKARGAAWRLIGSQIVFSRMNVSVATGDENPFNYDQWDGYVANRNRTFQHLYNNNITDNIMLAGDSHMSWVSDLVWLGDKSYDPVTGSGSVGVEFAGTAVSSPSPGGQNITQSAANVGSTWLVGANQELQWQDAYYRGYFELNINYTAVTAQYYGVPTLVQRTPYEISLANSTVLRGANSLQRPIANGMVESGALKNGTARMLGITNNTLTGGYSVTNLTTFGYNQSVPSGWKNPPPVESYRHAIDDLVVVCQPHDSSLLTNCW